MILSVRIIKHPRKRRVCGNCDCLINGEQLKLYGMAEYGDDPYNLYLHPFACEGRSPLDDPEVLKKLPKAHLQSVEG